MESIISSYGRLFTRFVIQRYIGNFIRTELNADQLEFQLAKDLSLSVQSVNLNTEVYQVSIEMPLLLIHVLVHKREARAIRPCFSH
jgi:hypothetical protein